MTEYIKKIQIFLLPKFSFKGNAPRYLAQITPLLIFSLASVSVVVYKLLTIIDDKYIIPTEIIASLYIISLFILLASLFVRVAIQIRKGNGYPVEADLSKRSFLIILVLIIGIFTAFKLPNFDNSFSGRRPLKYNTYVEPALYMFERNNPLHMQRRYLHSPVTDSQGMGATFENIPLLEWMLYGTFKLTYNSIGLENSTHLLTHTLGTGILGALAYLLSKLFSRKLALLSVFLLALNPIFNVATFITVYDTLNLLLFLISTSLIVRAIKMNKPPLSYIVAAGLIFGVAVAVKANTLLWGAPLLFLLILSLKQAKVKEVVPMLGLFSVFAVIPQLMTIYGIRPLPSATTGTYLTLAAFIVGTTILTAFRARIYTLFTALGTFMEKHRTPSIITSVILGSLAVALLIIYMPDRLSSEFITDFRLLFNFDVYLRMFREQLVPYLTLPVFVMGLLSIPLIIVKEKKQVLVLFGAFAFASLIYAILASKSLYFHSYYWQIIFISSIMIASKLILYSLRGLSQSSQVFIVLLFAAALILHSKPLIHAKIGTEYPEIADLTTYISENMEEDDVYIDEANAISIIFETGIYQLYSYEFFYNEGVKELVATEGFVDAMGAYNMRYVITLNGAQPNYSQYIPVFSNELKEMSTLRRTDIIYAELYPTKYEFNPDAELRLELIEEYNPQQYFCYIAKFGRYSVFEITEECDEEAIGLETLEDDSQ